MSRVMNVTRVAAALGAAAARLRATPASAQSTDLNPGNSFVFGKNQAIHSIGIGFGY
jgi:hypothetical protein